jgi:hypothetical protein
MDLRRAERLMSTAAFLQAASAVVGGLIVGALEEWRARRRARQADIEHERRAKQLVDIALGVAPPPE